MPSLTSKGVPVDEDAGKLCSFVLGGTRHAVGFTGLARVGGFDIRRWLLVFACWRIRRLEVSYTTE